MFLFQSVPDISSPVFSLFCVCVLYCVCSFLFLFVCLNVLFCFALSTFDSLCLLFCKHMRVLRRTVNGVKMERKAGYDSFFLKLLMFKRNSLTFGEILLFAFLLRVGQND